MAKWQEKTARLRPHHANCCGASTTDGASLAEEDGCRFGEDGVIGFERGAQALGNG
jgi:hypothetical protein